MGFFERPVGRSSQSGRGARRDSGYATGMGRRPRRQGPRRGTITGLGMVVDRMHQARRHVARRGELRKLDPVARAEFGEQCGNVKLYSSFADAQPRGDFLVGEVLRDGLQDFLLAAAE